MYSLYGPPSNRGRALRDAASNPAVLPAERGVLARLSWAGEAAGLLNISSRFW